MRIVAWFLVVFLGATSVGFAREPIAATIYKDPQCSCCNNYAAYLRLAGFTVEIVDTADVWSVKQEHGVPDDLASCHTMTIGDYVVEGHAPVATLNRLLEEKPPIKGIALPGMPQGSLGMSGEKEAPFEVFTISDDRPRTVYAVE